MLLRKEKLNDLLDLLVKDSTVFVPKSVEGQTRFAPYEQGEAVEFGVAKTDVSPKELLFPQTETVYTYEKQGEDVTIEEVVTETNQVFFGVRSCDAYGIDRLDELFLTLRHVDKQYCERRTNTLIIALGCSGVDRSCFCASFGINPALGSGADIQLTEVPEGYFVEALTDKGTETLKAWSPLLEKGEKPETTELEFTLAVDTKNLKESLRKMFEDPYWEDLSLSCLGCGTCAFVCPTCYCFDISQNNKGNAGYRYRTWDSCTFADYSLMAGFHNPRPTRRERLRNRFMHKLCFFEERYGSSLCCGCGRCIERCPVNIDISQVIEDTEKVVSK